MSRVEHHVMPSSDGGWKIVRSDTNEAYGHFSTRDEAIAVAKEVSKLEEGVLVVHDDEHEEESAN
jgi:hypothetical protein